MVAILLFVELTKQDPDRDSCLLAVDSERSDALLCDSYAV